MSYYMTKLMPVITILTFTIHCSKEPTRPLTLAESIAIGGMIGAAEVTLPGQIINYAMNCKIAGKPFELPKSYNGFPAHVVGQMPIVAVQKSVQTKGSQYLESWQNSNLSDLQRAMISYIAGITGALVDTPSNAIQLYQQTPGNHNKNMLQVMAQLKKRLFHGFAASALIKEGPFAVGYQMFEGKTTEIAQGFISNNVAASVTGGVTAGIVTACITQPGAVLRNTMQKNSFSNIHHSTLQTVQQIYKKEGIAGLFRGLKERGARISCAIPLYVFYGKCIEHWLKNN